MHPREFPQVRCGCRRVINTKDIEIYRQYINQDPINGGQLALRKLGITYACCADSIINVPKIPLGVYSNPDDIVLPREVETDPSKFTIYNSQRPRGKEQKRVIDLAPFNRTFQKERFFDYSNITDFGEDLYAVYDFWSALQGKTTDTFKQLRFLLTFSAGRDKWKEGKIEDLQFEYIDNSTYESYVQSPANYYLVVTCDDIDYVFLYAVSVVNQVLCFINDKQEKIILKTVPQSLSSFLGKFISKDSKFLTKLFGYEIQNYNNVEIKMYRTKVNIPLPGDFIPLITDILKQEKDTEVIAVLKDILTKINV
jgi:hypothetical protein